MSLQPVDRAAADALRADLLRTVDGPVRFDYRLVAPLYDGEGLVATAWTGDDGSVEARVTTRGGRPTARGSLTRLTA